jgi:hypothetical protein
MPTKPSDPGWPWGFGPAYVDLRAACTELELAPLPVGLSGVMCRSSFRLHSSSGTARYDPPVRLCAGR